MACLKIIGFGPRVLATTPSLTLNEQLQNLVYWVLHTYSNPFQARARMWVFLQECCLNIVVLAS